MCARSRRRTQSLFGCLGMKITRFFSRAQEEERLQTRRAYRVFYRCALKIKRRKYLSVFFSLEKFLFLFANKNARLVFVRSSCASVNYIIKVSYHLSWNICDIFFFAREFRVCVPPKFMSESEDKREREREEVFETHPSTSGAQHSKKENRRECISPPDQHNTSARGADAFNHSNASGGRERGRTRPATPEKF